MKGGCSPQNDPCLESSAKPCNKNFNKFGYNRDRFAFKLPAVAVFWDLSSDCEFVSSAASRNFA
jgi:hypothetical protein